MNSTTAWKKNALLSRDLTEIEEREILESSSSPYEMLLLGCRGNSPFLVEQAVLQGAMVNRRDRESWTPLMHAAYHNSWKVIPVLIRYRAVPHLRDDSGESPLDIARDMENGDSLDELNRSLRSGRMKQAGLFLQSLIHLMEEKSKPENLQNKTAMALCYIDLGYGWWLSEERIDKTFHYFRKASSLDPRVGGFPYASLLASCGYPEEAFQLLFQIAKRRWGIISKDELINDEAFHSLHNFDGEMWAQLLRLWP